MFPDEEPNLLTGWDELTSAGLIDLCEAVKTWVKGGSSRRVRLCDEYPDCKNGCPASTVHTVKPLSKTRQHSSLCNALSESFLTTDEALVLVEHEMTKRGMMKDDEVINTGKGFYDPKYTGIKEDDTFDCLTELDSD